MSLAEDLVAAAAQAIDAHLHEVNDPALAGDWTSSPEDFTGYATVAVAAALKRLAAKPDGYLRSQEDGGITYTRTLRKLAEDLEAGRP